MTRDPIGELGGINLYGFVGNDAVNFVDLWGFAGVINNTDETVTVAGNVGIITGSGPQQVQVELEPGETINIFNPKDGVRDVDAVDTNRDGVADVNLDSEKIPGTSFFPWVEINKDKDGNITCDFAD
jgi:hypothetical protein